MEDKIRRLCSELLAEGGDEDFGPLIVELRDALHQHIERLRERFGNYPFVAGQRTTNGVSSPDDVVQDPDGAKEAKETSAAEAAS
jgi:hypothetical protein